MPLSIQIQRSLMQTQKWRFLGFVSAVVGLLCYALSSSFNLLFGHWNFLKLFLYFIFSFIIIFITLFAKIWQFSTTTLFKTRMAVLVLLATTFYSFFYDKAVNQKPDAYILISCLAFAVMSLSLSKQTHFGCEMEVENYFVGCLIILLMKINLWLFFVGAGFICTLHIFFYSSSDVTSQSGSSEDHIVIQVVHNQEANTNGAVQVDPQLVNTDSAIQVSSQHVNTDSAIQLDSLNVNGALIMPQLKAYITTLNRDLVILHQQETILEYDLHASKDDIELLRDDNLVIDSLPQETIDNLQKTITLMAADGFEKQCYYVYTSCRRNILQKSFPRNFSELKGKGSLNSAISIWRITSDTAVKILFPCKRRLCERLFSGFSSAVDLFFVEICREFAIDLLKIPNMTIQRRSLSHLRSNLEVFQALTGLIPEFKSLFYGDYCASLINEAITTWERLGETIRMTFMDLENNIFLDMAQNSVPDGWIDPITQLVESCFSIVSRGRNTLEQIWRGKETLEQISNEYPIAVVGDREETFSSLSIHMAHIMELLYCNLEAKSKNHPSPALGYVFMVNNYNYIVQRLKISGLAAILGEDWIIKHTTKFQHKFEWDKVLDILKLDSNVSEESMIEKLMLFNMQFKEMHNFQFVLNGKHRQQISESIEKNLLPAYGNFIGRFQNLIGKHAYEYIEYSMFDIDALVNNLLRGSKKVSQLISHH